MKPLEDGHPRKIRKSEMRDTHGFKTIVGPSFTTRVYSRMLEGALHHFTLAFLQSFLPGEKIMHRRTLWKSPSRGSYEHKNDKKYNDFYVFFTISPSIAKSIDDTEVKFNNNTPLKDAGYATLQ